MWCFDKINCGYEAFMSDYGRASLIQTYNLVVRKVMWCFDEVCCHCEFLTPDYGRASLMQAYN